MSNKPEPDSDSINMFIGQLPRNFDEKTLENFLLPYGPIYETRIMKDKITGMSKGCGFVTFYSRNDALKAQMALHNLKILPGMSNPIQIKPADIQTNTVEQRRLFVGMLGKMMTEEEVSALFYPYGNVEEVTLMKDFSSISYNKGYGFVIMSTKSEAENAINNLNKSITCEGVKVPLVVKIAYTNRDKEKMISNNKSDFNKEEPYTAKFQHDHFENPFMGTDFGKFDNNINPNTLIPSNQAELQQLLISAVITSPLLQSNPIGMAILIGSLGIGQNLNLNSNQNNNQMNLRLPFMQNNLFASNLYKDSNSLPINDQVQKNYSQNNNPVKSSGGSNLVVSNLPKDYTNDNLYQLFSSYGRIISAKVFYDKEIGRNKNYGFVSYDNKFSAQKAIQEMNNLQINETRLKVYYKDERKKPY